jgi:hypothetical protein
MGWLSELGRRLGMLFRGERFVRDLREEMRLHFELRQQEHMGLGFAHCPARWRLQPCHTVPAAAISGVQPGFDVPDSN